jgi:hypothetical protein
MELAVGTWLLENNDEFLGRIRKQDPITAIDFSVIRRFRPCFWGSLDPKYYLGGSPLPVARISVIGCFHLGSLQ